MNNFSSLIDLIILDECNGTPRHERIVSLGATPDYLQKNALFSDLELVITGKVIGKAHFDHGIGKKQLKNLPAILERPKSVFKSANAHQFDSVVVLTFEVKGTYPIIIPIRGNRLIGRNQKFNLITSIYAKEGPDPEEKWKQQGLLMYVP